MKKLLTILLVLVWAATGWAQDWTTGQTADSMDCTRFQSTNPSWNFGAALSVSIRTGSGVTTTDNSLFQPAHDLRTGGYTQDSVKLWIYINAVSDPDADADSLTLYGYILRRDWGEGNNTGSASDAGESSWDDYADPSAWTTGGAKNTTSDRQAAVACSVLVPGAAGGINNTWLTLTIGASHIDNDDLWNYGVVVEVGRADVGFETISIAADDNGTAANRPYFEGWESAPATAATVVGAATVGAATVGSQ